MAQSPDADPGTWADGEGEPSGRLLVDDVDCRNCAHYPVCAVISGIRPMLENWQAGDRSDEEAPIDPNELAHICDEYEEVE